MKNSSVFRRDSYIIPNIGVKPAVNYPMHCHRHIEFVMITDGKIEMEINGKNLMFNKGDMVIIAPYVLHNYKVNDKAEHYIAVFEPESFGILGNLLLKKHPVNPFISKENIIKSIPDIYNRLDKAHQLYVDHYNQEAEFQIPAISTLFSALADMLTLCEYTKANDENEHYAFIRAIEVCLKRYYEDNIIVSDISKEVGLSNSKLQKLFAKNMKMGVKEYINYLRVAHAEKLLKETNLSISEIAYLSGFGTVRTFNRVFLKLKGVTPTQVRTVNEI